MIEKSRKVEKYKYSNYLKRAEQFMEGAKEAFGKRNFDLCVSNAVHCGISASDAMCVAFQGKRPAGDDHRVASYMFSQIDNECREKATHLNRLIGLKTASEYGEENMTEKDAEEALKHSERFLSFVKSRLGKLSG